jgi:hypothetical protein
MARRASVKVAELLLRAAKATPDPLPPTAPRDTETRAQATASAIAIDVGILSLPPSWLTDAPIRGDVPVAARFAFEPLTLALRARDGRVWYASTSDAAYRELRESGRVVLSGGELGALAIGAEQGRSSHVWLGSWLANRAAGDWSRLDVAVALGGYEGEQTPNQRWSLTRVMFAWGVELLDVGLGDLAKPDWICGHETSDS